MNIIKTTIASALMLAGCLLVGAATRKVGAK